MERQMKNYAELLQQGYRANPYSYHEELEKMDFETAQSQGQAVRFFRDPFKLVPISNVADMRIMNCIMTSNEMRSRLALSRQKILRQINLSIQT